MKIKMEQATKVEVEVEVREAISDIHINITEEQKGSE